MSNSGYDPLSAWPPPPNTQMPAFNHLRPPLQPLAGLCRAFLVLVVILIAGNVASACLGELTKADGVPVDVWSLLASLLIILVYCVYSVIFAVWLYRAYANLDSFFVQGRMFTPAILIVFYIVPLVNLVIPFLALQEIWRASDPDFGPDPASWRKAPALGVVWLYWGITLGTGVAVMGWLTYTVLVAIEKSAPTPQPWYATWMFTLLSCVTTYLAYACVRAITQRQEAKDAALLAPP